MKKLALYTNMKSEKEEVLAYKLLSDREIIKLSNIDDNAVVLIKIIDKV